MMIISTIQKISLYLLSLCRLSITHRLANILAIILYSDNSKKYIIAHKNLSICFPEKSSEWIEETARKSLVEYLKSLLESPYLYRFSDNNIDKFINNVHNKNCIENCAKENNGIIFMTPHHGSWELSGLYVASKIRTYTMFKPLRNKALNDFVYIGRQATGAKLVETDNSGVKKLLKALKNNCAIGILPDHTPKINQGIMSKFYNIPVNTTSLIYKLGKKNKVPIIYVYAERLPKNKGFDIHLDVINKEFYDLNEGGAADLLNKTIENLVSKNISQYLWSYERFRNRSGVKENIYKKD